MQPPAGRNTGESDSSDTRNIEVPRHRRQRPRCKNVQRRIDKPAEEVLAFIAEGIGTVVTCLRIVLRSVGGRSAQHLGAPLRAGLCLRRSAGALILALVTTETWRHRLGFLMSAVHM